MAMFPCDADKRRYAGAQQTIYPAIARAGETARRKLRFCSWHFDLALEKLEKNAQNSQLEFDQAEQSTCFVCHKTVTETDTMFFATVYALHQERRDFWAPLHDECVLAAMEDWQLPV